MKHYTKEEWAKIERIEYQLSRWITRIMLILLSHHLHQAGEIRFLKFRRQPVFP